MTTVVISAGSNMSNPQAQIEAAIQELNHSFLNVNASSLYHTQPVGPIEQAAYVNAAIRFETDRNALEVLDSLLTLERKAGRDRANEIPQGPRTLDLDIILFGSEIWSSDDLMIPHPRFRERRFVLEPACEVAPQLIDPISSKSIQQLKLECIDESWTTQLNLNAETV